MSMKTFRICEEADAKLMLKDGTFEGYLQMWLDRFPNRDGSALQKIKEIKEEYGYGFKEAKDIYFAIYRNDVVRFEIGDKIKIVSQCGIQLHTKDGKGWRIVYSGDGTDAAATLTRYMYGILRT
jgi:hypothetical protein